MNRQDVTDIWTCLKPAAWAGASTAIKSLADGGDWKLALGKAGMVGSTTFIRNVVDFPDKPRAELPGKAATVSMSPREASWLGTKALIKEACAQAAGRMAQSALQQPQASTSAGRLAQLSEAQKVTRAAGPSLSPRHQANAQHLISRSAKAVLADPAARQEYTKAHGPKEAERLRSLGKLEAQTSAKTPKVR